jgi:hypothetical protein
VTFLPWRISLFDDCVEVLDLWDRYDTSEMRSNAEY